MSRYNAMCLYEAPADVI